MKIQTKIGNLLNVKEGHIVHGCNAQGVMGSGVALGVKNTYPSAYEDYIKQYNSKEGLILGVAYPSSVSDNLVIWNAITQNLFGAGTRQVSYDAIETCFSDINRFLKDGDGIWAQEIHIPYIGAGLGGGSWNIIKSIIEDTVSFPVTVWSINGKDPYGMSIVETE